MQRTDSHSMSIGESMARIDLDTSPGTQMITRLVTRFADDMARELDANPHKRGWHGMSVRQCLARAEQEMSELRRAIESGEPFDVVRSEAADVGNFLAMLVWNACVASRAEVSWKSTDEPITATLSAATRVS